jgi:uncharacterized membrane protein YdjX (TVP38/TMEM64 family)
MPSEFGDEDVTATVAFGMLSAMVQPKTAVRVAAVVGVIAALAIAYRLGVLGRFADPGSVARMLVDLGVWGYVAFVGAYAAFQPFGIPGTAFVLAAALIWPWPIAFALSMAGTMAASVVGFSFARLVARDWVARMIPARFRKYDEALAARAFATVFVLRLVFWMPPLLHAFFGVSRVGFWTHFWGSLAGYVVPLFLMSYFGQKIFDALKDAPAGVWIALGIAVAVAVTAGIIVVGRRRRGRPSSSAG